MRFFGCLAASAIILAVAPLRAQEVTVQERQIGQAATNDQNPMGTSVLEGRVVDDDGQPVADTLLELRVWEWNWPRPLRTVRSSADGRFRFSELDGRKYSLLTQVDGRVLALQYVDVDDKQNKEIELRVSRGVQQIVKITDSRGQPVSGARLTDLTMQVPANGKYWIGMSHFDRFHVPRLVSDENGLLKLPLLVSGTLATICVEHPDFAVTALSNFTVQDQQPIQLSLDEGTQVRLHLKAADDLGRPLDEIEFCVNMVPLDRLATGSLLQRILFKPRNNVIEFRVKPGQYARLRVETESIKAFVTPTLFGAQSELPELLVPPGPPVSFSLLVRSAFPVSGRLLSDETRVSVARLHMWGLTQNFDPEGRLYGYLEAQHWTTCKWGESNAQGEYVVYLPAGPGRVELIGRSLGTEQEFYEIDVRSTGENRLPDITIGRLPVLTGTVVDQQGLPCPDAVLRVIGDSNIVTQADRNGSFKLKLSHLPMNWKLGQRNAELTIVAYMPRDLRAGIKVAMLDDLDNPLTIALESHAAEWVVETMRDEAQKLSGYQDREDDENVIKAKRMIGQPVPELDCREWLNVQRGEKSLADFRGKCVLLDFWTTSCGICHAEFPMVNLAQKLYEDELVVIGVHNNSRPPAEIQNHVRDMKLAFPIAIDHADGRTLTAYENLGVLGFPTYVLIDPQGNLLASRYIHSGIVRLLKLELVRQSVLKSTVESRAGN